MKRVIRLKSDFIYICLMQLSNFISDLLYRYECVVVPGFGGFISNTISSKVNHYTHTFYPPTKRISFNSQLQTNDGLLTKYISEIENISFEEANKQIETTVAKWKTTLKSNTLVLDKIGSISKNNENKLEFTPNELTNYLTSSFGLNSFNSPSVKRITAKEKVVALNPETPKKKSSFYKYSAAAAILFALGTFAWQSNQEYTSKLEAKEQEIVTKKIQEASFIIGSSMPEIRLDVVKATEKKYHLIAGAFGNKANAHKKLNQLVKQGFDAKIIGVNKWGLTQVAFESFASRNEASKSLKIIKATVAKDAWMYVE